MKKSMLFTTLAFLAVSLYAAETSPKDEVTAAAKKLADKPNYSWKQTVVVPESAQFRPGPTEGKTEKDGLTHLTWSFNDNVGHGVVKGDKGAATDPDGSWQSLAELENSEGFGRFTARRLRNLKTPVLQVIDLANATTGLKKDGDAYAGELTAEGAAAQLRFGPTSEVSNAKGSVKFWLKDGMLSKYEIKVKGTVKFNDNEFENDRTTTIEIKDVGTTKVTVPDEAKRKLS